VDDTPVFTGGWFGLTYKESINLRDCPAKRLFLRAIRRAS